MLDMTNKNMPTIAEFANTMGVSKSTVANKIRELGLETITDAGDRRGRQLLPAATCSALADKLANATKRDIAAADEGRLLELYKAQIEPLQSANESLRAQVDSLLRQIEQQERAAAEQVRVADERAAELRASVARLEAEKDDLRRELEMARALEGFHWPWQRDRIRARYALPSSQG